MRSNSKISFSFESEKTARDLYRVINPEVRSDKRAQTIIKLEGKEVSLWISAIDRVAHRAAVNSYGRWLRLYEEIGGIR